MNISPKNAGGKNACGRNIGWKGRAGLALLCLLPLSALPAAQADTPQNTITNTIAALKTVRTGRLLTYNIVVSSTAPFPMRDEVVTLSVGGREFINSSYVSGGTLNTLVFSLTAKEFAALPTGAPVRVYYGHDDAALPAAQWDFGTLDKSRLDKGPAAPPVAATTTAAVNAAAKTTAKLATAKLARKGHQ